jgi:hypothetical protein
VVEEFIGWLFFVAEDENIFPTKFYSQRIPPDVDNYCGENWKCKRGLCLVKYPHVC